MMGGMEMAYELTPILNNKDWNRLYLQYASLYGAPIAEAPSCEHHPIALEPARSADQRLRAALRLSALVQNASADLDHLARAAPALQHRGRAGIGLSAQPQLLGDRRRAGGDDG